MDLDRHDFELDELMERIRANDNRLIALQVPEGLKMQALEMMDTIETETSAQVVLAADPCYGACDLVHDKMQLMGVELVAHMGHSQMNIDSGMPTQFINVTYDGDPELSPRHRRRSRALRRGVGLRDARVRGGGRVVRARGETELEPQPHIHVFQLRQRVWATVGG